MFMTYLPTPIRAQAEIERRRRMKIGEDSGYQKFQKMYWNDLAGFAQDCIQWENDGNLANYQLEAMRGFVASKRFSMRGPHGLGKTALSAIVILWFALPRDGKDWKAPTLASAWRQLERFLWPEIHKWSRRLRWDIIGRGAFSRNELLTLNLKLNTGEAFAIASDTPAMIEGAHGENLLYLFDESKTIPDDTWDAAEGAMSTGDCYWLAVSTPGEPLGRFYDIHARKAGYEDWHVFKVTLEMAINAGRINPDWAKARERQWGKDSSVYINRVLGDFASSDEDSVIPLSWVERSNERWLAKKELEKAKPDIWGEVIGLGVDVGRGGDPSVIGIRCGNAIKEFRRLDVRDVMQVTGVVVGLLQLHTSAKASIDVIGIGAGVYDRAKEAEGWKIKERVLSFNASEKTEMKDSSGELGFINLRSSAWWNVREMLQLDEIDLPPDDELTGELVAPKWKVMSGGKIQVESKDDIKKRIGRSTNYADTVIQVFAPMPKPKIAGTFGRS